MIGSVFQSVKESFISNPVATRTFRTQMRGKKAPRLWGLYAAILVVFAALIYASALSGGPASIAQIQQRLSMLNSAVMGLLWVAVGLVAPAISVSLVVGEYDRRSLDLILSAPLNLNAFFTGKLISSWRVVWMLLILAMPVSSVCVVMGGATIIDVFLQYLAVAGFGLIVSAVALPVAVLTKKMVPALFTVYGILTLPYFGLALGAGGIASRIYMASVSSSSGFGAASVSPAPGGVPPFGLSLPLTVASIAMFCLSVGWLCLTGASASLSKKGSREEKTLRWGALVLSVVWMGFFGLMGLLGPGIAPGGDRTMLSSQPGFFLVSWTALLVTFMPHLATWDWLGESKRAPDSLVSLRGITLGGVAGGLPFVLLTYFLGAAAMGGGQAVLGRGLPQDYWVGLIWGGLCLFWVHSMFRLGSAFSPLENGQPKKLGTGLTLIVGLIPFVLLGFVASSSSSPDQFLPLTALAPLAGPFLPLKAPEMIVLNAFVLLITGLAFNSFSARLRSRRMPVKP